MSENNSSNEIQLKKVVQRCILGPKSLLQSGESEIAKLSEYFICHSSPPLFSWQIVYHNSLVPATRNMDPKSIVCFFTTLGVSSAANNGNKNNFLKHI